MLHIHDDSSGFSYTFGQTSPTAVYKERKGSVVDIDYKLWLS